MRLKPVSNLKLRSIFSNLDLRSSVMFLIITGFTFLSSLGVFAQGVPTNQLGQLLWSANHLNGNVNEWTSDGGGGIYNTGTGRTVVSTEQAKTGIHSLKLSINTTTGDSHGTRVYRWREIGNNDDLIYTFHLYFPHRIDLDPNNAWFNLVQTKGVKYAAGGAGTGPDQINNPHYVVGLGVRGGANFLTLADLQRFWGGTTNVTWQAPPGINLPIGRWVKIQMLIIQRRDNSGRILLWQDDQLVIDTGLRNTLRPDVDANHFSINAYADKTIPNNTSIYLDDVSINLPGNQSSSANKVFLESNPEPGGSVRISTQKNESTVNITEPVDNAVFEGNATVNIKTNMTNTNSPISKVEFYYGTELIGTKTQAPFDLNWSPPGNGLYRIRVKGFFENGDSKFSEFVNFVVK